MTGPKKLAPIIWWYLWPHEVRYHLVSDKNPTGDITNSGLEMAAEVIGWLVLEAYVPLKWEHAGVCSNNMHMVSWAIHWASRRS